MILLSILAASLVQDASAPSQEVADDAQEICIVGNRDRFDRMEVLRKDIEDVAIEIERLAEKLEHAKSAYENSARRAGSFSQDRRVRRMAGTSSSEEQVFVGSHRGREEMTGLQAQVEHQQHLVRLINTQIEIRNAKIIEFRELESQPQQVTECNAENP